MSPAPAQLEPRLCKNLEQNTGKNKERFAERVEYIIEVAYTVAGPTGLACSCMKLFVFELIGIAHWGCVTRLES